MTEPRTAAGREFLKDAMWQAEAQKVTRAFRLATEQYVTRIETEAAAPALDEIGLTNLGYREGRLAAWQEAVEWAQQNLDVAQRVAGVTSEGEKPHA